MGKEKRYYREYLKEELERRMLKNPSYSLRAFAQSLEIDSSYLSKTLSRKHHFTLEAAEKVCVKLKLNPENRKKFIQSVADGRMCRSLYKVDPSLTDCESETKAEKRPRHES